MSCYTVNNTVKTAREIPCENERDEMICRNMLLVTLVANKFACAPIEYDDMVSAGTLGLIKAVDTFDPNMGYKFSSYAGRCIKNEILMLLRRENKRRSDISLQSSIAADHDGGELLVSDLLPADDDVEMEAETDLMLQMMNDRIDVALKPLEKKVIDMRYFYDMKQREIADSIGHTQASVSRIIKRAQRKLGRQMGVIG